MASTSSLWNSLAVLARTPSHSSPSSNKKGFVGGRRLSISCRINSHDESQVSPGNGQEEIGAAKRREIVLQLAAFSALSIHGIAAASSALAEQVVAEDFRVFSDDVNKFKISIPEDWQIGTGESNGFKSVTAFYPKEDYSSCNVSVAITGIGPDFTSLGSFGKVDAFAESLVNGLDRSWQRPPGVAAKLINCRDSKGLYYIEYTLQNPGESKRHIYSAIGMASNGWYNRLYTVTGQYLEEEAAKSSSKIDKVVSSFGFI